MSTETKFTQKRLIEILDAYGAYEGQWPEKEHAAALEYVAQSHDAQLLVDDARKLDELFLQNSSDVRAPAHLMDLILAQTYSPPQKISLNLGDMFTQFLRPVAGLAFATCLGVTIGILNPDLLEVSNEVSLDELAVSDTVLDWEDDNDNS